MTTNVLDRVNNLMATDSRWSQQWGKWLVYVDDTAFHKIEITPDKTVAFMFAGRGVRIQEWKDWIKGGGQQTSVPEFDGVCLCAVGVPDGDLKICENLPIVRNHSAFGGSGSRFACMCWDDNQDAIKAVETAKSLDPATGGVTTYLNIVSREHNLQSIGFRESSLKEVDQAILTRGTVMDTSVINNSAPIGRLGELAASNDEVRQLQQKIANGELSAEAPSAGMFNDWTDEQKTRVKTALGKIFKW